MNSSEDIWFSGPVQDAVSLVAERNCVFLVYIFDDSDKSNTLNVVLKDQKVIEAIKEYTVALSMEKNSNNTTLFGQFYPTQTVPILYLIKQGTIKDFGVETVTSQELIDKIITVHGTQAAGAASQPSVHMTNATSQQQQQQQEQSTSTSEQPISVSPPPNSTAVTADENKKEKLQKQLEQVRKERAEREQKEAKEREIKRRQDAKSMQEANQNRVDKENKIYFDKLKKERLEDEAHRKRVRQQIAADRAEKIARREAEKQRQDSSTSSFENKNEKTIHKSSAEFNTSHLNIRQLDGTNIRHRFEATTNLSVVRDWITQNRTDDSRKSYKLSSQFPTRLFTEEDDNVCLSDLGLCPSATIIMKPVKTSFASSSSSSSAGNRGGIIGNIIKIFDLIYGFFVALINILFGLLASLFSTSGPAPHAVPGSQPQQPVLRNLRGGQRLGGEPLNKNNDASSSLKDENSTRRRNPYATRVNTLQEDGSDDDEKRPTYNGNSVNHE